MSETTGPGNPPTDPSTEPNPASPAPAETQGVVREGYRVTQHDNVEAGVRFTVVFDETNEIVGTVPEDEVDDLIARHRTVQASGGVLGQQDVAQSEPANAADAAGADPAAAQSQASGDVPPSLPGQPAQTEQTGPTDTSGQPGQ